MEENCKTNAKPKTFGELVKSWVFWKPVLSVTAGGIAGYLYYFFVGCASGSCAITSNPFMSILFGASIGLFIVNKPCKVC